MIAETIVTAAILCSNANMDVSERCKAPVDLETLTNTPSEVILGKMDWSGTLTSGVQFTQKWIGTQTMRFEAENMRWLVTPYGVIYY